MRLDVARERLHQLHGSVMRGARLGALFWLWHSIPPLSIFRAQHRANHPARHSDSCDLDVSTQETECRCAILSISWSPQTTEGQYPHELPNSRPFCDTVY